jgi:RHS repeat-associated protein
MWSPTAGQVGIQASNLTPSMDIYTPTDGSATTNRMSGTVYDASGNQLVLGADTMTYDAENRITTVTGTPVSGGGQVSYGYDGDGRRVTKTFSDGTTTVYVYDAFGSLTAEYSSVMTVGAPLCVTCYVSTDHLGSTRMVTDQNGAVVGRHDYLPFGEEVPASTVGRRSEWSASDSVKQKFTAKERDQETGLDYFGARYMSSAQGRFTSPDPSRLSAFISDPQSWNMYSYAYNNPLQFVDRNGKWPTKIHNQIIDAAFPNLTPAQRQILKDVSAHQDAFLTDHTIMGGQAAAVSFQHAMRAPGQSVTEAQQEYEDFVSMNEDQATRTQIDFWAAGNPGLSNDALAQFAAALHAVLDSTSPAHSGFQAWEWWHFRRHNKAEATINSQQLNTAVTAARNAFDQTFHPNFNEFDLLQLQLRSQQQTAVNSKFCYYTDDGKQVCQ